MKANRFVLLAGLAVLVYGLSAAIGAEKETKKVENRLFELRTYYAAPGKMEALHARFRDHTTKLFEKHGITIVGFWSPVEPEKASKVLIYLLAYPNKASAEKSWAAFRADPEWDKARTESEKDGKLVEKVDSVYMNPTDYSPMK
jgi:hypothetical protein